MATAAKKTVAPRRPMPNTTRVGSSGEIVENGDEVKVNLATTAGDDLEDEEEVTVVVPKDFTLTLDNRQQVQYRAGVQEMRLSHAAHWWSRAQGVKVYDPDAKK